MKYGVETCVSEDVDPATLPLSHAVACRDPRLAPGGKLLSVATLWRLINKVRRLVRTFTTVHGLSSAG